MASKWIQFPDATLTNGSKIVSVNDGADTSGVLAGYALIVNGEFLEIDSKTSNSISLVNTYAGATQTNVAAQVMQTHASLEESLLAALQRLNTNADTFDQVKSAALRDVQTSPTDTTADRLMAVGAFGWGGSVVLAETDLGSGQYLVSGCYITPSSGMTDLPSGFTQSNRLIVLVEGDVGARKQTLVERGSSSVYVRVGNPSGTGYLDWKRIDPQGFGLGLDGSESRARPTNCNDFLISGTVPVASVATNAPPDSSGTQAAFLSCEVWEGNTDIKLQKYFELNTGKIWTRQLVGGVWQPWQPVYTGSNYQPENQDGLGVVRRMQNVSGGTILGGTEDIPGASLRYIETNASGSIVGTSLVTGSYKLNSKMDIENNNIGEFVRTE